MMAGKTEGKNNESMGSEAIEVQVRTPSVRFDCERFYLT